jgi:hypothetical protein
MSWNTPLSYTLRRWSFDLLMPGTLATRFLVLLLQLPLILVENDAFPYVVLTAGQPSPGSHRP